MNKQMSELMHLQELREKSISRRKEIQEKIDSHFLKNPPRRNRKQKRQKREDDHHWSF
jgi:hypothetical protein